MKYIHLFLHFTFCHETNPHLYSTYLKSTNYSQIVPRWFSNSYAHHSLHYKLKDKNYISTTPYSSTEEFPRHEFPAGEQKDSSNPIQKLPLTLTTAKHILKSMEIIIITFYWQLASIKRRTLKNAGVGGLLE
jgi:hypothetical protein